MSTFSNLHYILPRSMYLLGQLSFHTTGEDYDALLLRRQPNLLVTKIEIRIIVEIQP
jgi:hypothetical protein